MLIGMDFLTHNKVVGGWGGWGGGGGGLAYWFHSSVGTSLRLCLSAAHAVSTLYLS